MPFSPLQPTSRFRAKLWSCRTATFWSLKARAAPQPAFSAALVAYVEARYDGDEIKNKLCTTVPFPDRPEDYPRSVLANMRNEVAWGRDPALRGWIRSSRLDGFGKIVDAVPPEDQDKMQVLGRIRNAAMPAAANLRRLAA